ncbi:MAG: thioredoxin family protein [Sediminicola sp.]
MSNTPSNMLPLGTTAPSFKLLDTVTSSPKELEGTRGPIGTMLVFICNHCPFVVHVSPKLAELSREYIAKGIHFVAISSNDIQKYPQDSPSEMKLFAERYGFSFPYLYDATQEVAKAYDAACTPDFYLFDKDLSLVYRGQFDSSRPGNGIPVTGVDLQGAMDALVDGRAVDTVQKPSMGCNIKWK